MPRIFLTCDRDQPLLQPPDLSDWLPEDHLARFMTKAIERRCGENAAFRMICANQAPDHVTTPASGSAAGPSQ